MSAYTKILQELMRRRRLIMDNFRARSADANPALRKQREAQARRELEKVDAEIAQVQAQLDGIDPKDLDWGPTNETELSQDIMDRYTREGIEQRYPDAKAIVDHPTGHIVVNPNGSARAVRSPGGFNQDYPSQQMDMFEPGTMQGGSRKGFPIEDDVWGHSRLTRDEMEGRYMILRKQSDELEASYQAGDIPRLKNSPHGESYEDGRARLNSALEDIEHRMQYNWD